MTEPRTRKPRAKAAVAEADAPPRVADMVSTKPPRGHPDYEFPKEVHNLLVVAQQGHVALSSMADTKASILMTATFVVFGMALNDIADSGAPVSLTILAGFSLVATIFSILAVRPALMKPPKTVSKNTNLVFFGSFAGISEDEYIDRIVAELRTEESTYRVMARDLYQNGRVLAFKKYRYLTYAYNTLLLGFAATVASFGIESLVHWWLDRLG